MQFRHHALCAAAAILWLTGCDKPPASATHATADKQLVDARDALQRQALEIETRTALMEKRVAEMERSLKEQENAGLRTSINALQQENEDLRAQAEDVRRQSDALSQRLVDEAPAPPGVVQQPAAAPDYTLFYESLAPYGQWLEVAGYGYCWQPTVSMAGWRPYWDGCWVWSEFGWAWQSNEPFGWLTYHYGRWVELSQYGWVWVPGSEWAPGWVAWRQSPDWVGWAPLPPEPGVCDGVYRDCDSRYGLGPSSYVFIPIIQFVGPSYISVYAPVTQYTTIYRESVNVTQIVPRSGHRHAFVQQGGPPRAQMEQACGRAVPQRQVQMMQAGEMPSQRQPRDQHRESPITMLDLPAVGPGVRVRLPEIRERVLHPVLVRGFAGGAAAETPQSPAIVRRDLERRSQEPPPAEPASHVSTAPGPVLPETARPAIAAEPAIFGQQAQAAEQDQRRQQEMNERAMADRRTAEQAAAAQQQQEAANQQRMTAEQERARRAAEATALQQQQDESNRRAAEEQMRTRQETERRTQEMARRQAEEQTRRAAEEQMKAQQESERQARQEAAQRAQDMAQRQAEEQARRAAEEQSRRAAEEQMKARQEAAQRAQEMARHQAEEQARRAAEESARRAQEEAHRAAESARNQPSRP